MIDVSVKMAGRKGGIGGVFSIGVWAERTNPADALYRWQADSGETGFLLFDATAKTFGPATADGLPLGDLVIDTSGEGVTGLSPSADRVLMVKVAAAILRHTPGPARGRARLTPTTDRGRERRDVVAMNERADVWLTQESENLLGQVVGLDEFIWRRASLDLSDHESRRIAAAVAERLITAGRAELYGVSWPAIQVQEGPLPVTVLRDPASWSPGDSGTLVALMPTGSP